MPAFGTARTDSLPVGEEARADAEPTARRPMPSFSRVTGLLLLNRLLTYGLTVGNSVVLHGVRVQTGHVKIALVDSQSGWDGEAKAVRAEREAPQGESQRFVFADLTPGTYAVMITHDENGNDMMDTNFVGMPIEGYGFSNNPRVMRKPTWEEARFELAADQTIDVTLR